MAAKIMVDVIIILIGIVLAFGSYDKIKAVFPRARSERQIKALGLLIASGGLIGTIMEIL
ncbi:hypothetical protein AALB16_12560 [Lachnospiraceae bacterium 62-35]